MRAPENHVSHRIGWLRAAVLGANDGILSTAGVVIGVAAAGSARNGILIAGMAGLVAGAMSMAAGEYVSVSSQADAESADLGRERTELAEDPEGELIELTEMLESRGVDPGHAREVAAEMMARDALGAHAREELGITEMTMARPMQAAVASAAAFTAGAALPLVLAALAPVGPLAWVVAGMSLVFLAGLGAVGARAGGAPVAPATLRVTLWGAGAMVATALIGKLLGAVV